MSRKLPKCQYPVNTSASDFECFGPVATKDTEFSGFRMADLGCFQQEHTDSNKFYFCCVTRHKITKDWYVYIEYGRVGNVNNQFQFYVAAHEEDANETFAKCCAEKNTKRGEWKDISGVKLFRPALDGKGKSKDLYSVRSLVSRSYGLPDARNIGVVIENHVAGAKVKKGYRCDQKTTKLMRDLIGGTISYTRTSMVGGSTPSQTAINEARKLLDLASGRVGKIGHNIANQLADNDLKQLSYALYSFIPKIKERGTKEDTWLLTQDNINTWQMDLDAFETALKTGDLDSSIDDPLVGFPLDMRWIDPNTDLGKWLENWWITSTRKKNTNVGPITVHNMWEIERYGDRAIIRDAQSKTLNEMPKDSITRPYHQRKDRPDLSKEERELFWDTNTALLYHGTRAVNTAGILRTSFRFPDELRGVTLTASMFGMGTYFADDHRKSCGYCSSPSPNVRSLYAYDGEVKGRRAFMFAVDVICGNPYIAPGAKGFTSPPGGHHCVMGKHGHTKGWNGPLINNEFVIYKKGRAEIRYLAELSWK